MTFVHTSPGLKAKERFQWCPGRVLQLVSVVTICQVTGLLPGLGHVQEATSECINGWNNKSMFLSLSFFLFPFLSLSQINNTLKKNSVVSQPPKLYKIKFLAHSLGRMETCYGPPKVKFRFIVVYFL